MRLLIFATVLAGLLSACATGPRAELRTGVASLSAGWTRITADDAHIALHHRDGGAIAASFACDAVDEDAPLDVLVNHVLLQLESPVERGRQPILLDGRAGLRVSMDVRLDGVPVGLDLVVFKKDGCVVDAQLVADSSRLAARRHEFDRFLSELSLWRKRR